MKMFDKEKTMQKWMISGLATLIIFLAANVYSQPERRDSVEVKLSKDLGLTGEQSQQLREILQNARAEANHISELNRSNPEAINSAMNDLRDQTHQQIENILTPVQLKKYQEIKNQLRLFREARNNQLAELQKRLNLTDEQIAQIEPIMTNAREKMQELRQNSSGDRREMRSQIRAIIQERDQKIEEILTDSQKAEYDKYIQEQREQIMNRREPRRN
jgi:Spy/CpxP family protein refolding chaperone